MKLATKASVFLDHTMSIPFFLAAVLVIFMMLAITTEVVARYFFGEPMSWMFEIVEYSLVFFTFLGTAWVLKVEEHVKMDVVLSRLNPGTQALLNIITSIICAALWLLLTWYAVKVTWENFQSGYYLNTLLGPPLFPMLAVIAFGSFLLFIQCLRRTYGFVGSRRAYQTENKSRN